MTQSNNLRDFLSRISQGKAKIAEAIKDFQAICLLAHDLYLRAGSLAQEMESLASEGIVVDRDEVAKWSVVGQIFDAVVSTGGELVADGEVQPEWFYDHVSKAMGNKGGITLNVTKPISTAVVVAQATNTPISMADAKTILLKAYIREVSDAVVSNANDLLTIVCRIEGVTKSGNARTNGAVPMSDEFLAHFDRLAAHVAARRAELV